MRCQVVAILLVILSTAATAQHVPVDWVDVAEESGYSLLPATRLTSNGDGTYSGGGMTLSTSGNVDYTLGFSGGVASIAGREDYWTGELITYSGQRYWHITDWADPPEEPEDESHPRKWVQIHIFGSDEDYSYNDAYGLQSDELNGVWTLQWYPEYNQYRLYIDSKVALYAVLHYNESQGGIDGSQGVGGVRNANNDLTPLGPLGTGPFIRDGSGAGVPDVGWDMDIVAWGPPVSASGDGDPPANNPGGTPDPPDPGGGGSDDPPDDDDPPDPPDDDDPPDDPEDPPTTPSEPSGFDCIDDWLAETQEEGFGAFVADFAGVSSRPYSYTISIPFPYGPDLTATITSDPGEMAYASSPLDTLRKWLRLVLSCIVVWKFGSAILTTIKQY